MYQARGVVWIHSASDALCPHIEWAMSTALGTVVRLDWMRQPADPGTSRAEYVWTGAQGSGAKLASALRACVRARFEVTEEATATDEGTRWSYTPGLGVHVAVIGTHGDVLVTENQLAAAVAADALGRRPLAEAIRGLLGLAWDAELEPFRYAGEGAPVRWLHRVS